MAKSPGNRPVLVAVRNADHVEQLVRTAGDLARLLDTGVLIVSIVVKPHRSPFSVYSDETIIERFAGDTREILDLATGVAPSDIPVDRDILVGSSVADGVLKAIDQTRARALVVGWHGPRNRADAILGTNLDRLIERAPTDCYVERIGAQANGVDSILLPVAGGPHVEPAVRAAKAIAVRNSATVHVLSVAAPEDTDGPGQTDVDSATRLLAEVPGPEVPHETHFETDTDVPGIIADSASEHDVTIFGVTRQGAIQRRLVGSVPQEVIRRTDGTVLLARSGDVVGQPRFSTIRRLWRHV